MYSTCMLVQCSVQAVILGFRGSSPELDLTAQKYHVVVYRFFVLLGFALECNKKL